MTTMIEKAKEHAYRAALATNDSPMCHRDGDTAYLGATAIDLNLIVRAVLAAIRDPDEAMLKAGTDADWVGENEGRAGLSIMPSVNPWHSHDDEDDPVAGCPACSSPGIWPAMIDAILKEGTDV